MQCCCPGISAAITKLCLQSCVYDTTGQQRIADTWICGLSSDKGQADAYRDLFCQAQVVIFPWYPCPIQQGRNDDGQFPMYNEHKVYHQSYQSIHHTSEKLYEFHDTDTFCKQL